jgi:hypothetical protein
LAHIPVRFRAINLNRTGDSSANSRLAFAVAQGIQGSPFFDKDGTRLSGELEQVGKDQATFTFEMVFKLRMPRVQEASAR